MADRTHELSIIARFKDLATAGIAKLASGLKALAGLPFRAIGKLTGGLRLLSVRLNQALEIGAKVIRGFQGLARAIAAPVREAILFNKTWAQVNAVLRSTSQVAGITAQAALDIAERLSAVSTSSKTAVLGLEAMVLTFTEIRASQKIFERTTAVIMDMSSALGRNLLESTIQIGKALNDPIIGIGALREVGVTFTEQTKEMVQSLAESGQIMAAQQIILAELEREFGGVAAAMRDTFGGAVDNLRNKWQDLLIALGQFIAQNDGIRAIIEQISTAIDSWTQSLERLRESEELQVRIGELFRRGLILLIRGIQGLIEAVGTAVNVFRELLVTLNYLPGITIPINREQRELKQAIYEVGLGVEFTKRQMDSLYVKRMWSQEARDEFARLKELLVEQKENLALLERQYEEAGRGADGFTDRVDGLSSAMDYLVERLENIDLTGSFKGAAAGAAAAKEGAEEVSAELGTWNLMLRGARVQMAEFLTEARNFVQTGRQMAENFLGGAQDSFGEFFRTLRDEGKLAWDDLADSLRMKLSDILIDFAAQQVVAAGVSALSSIPGLGDPRIRTPEGATEANTAALVANTTAIQSMTAGLIPGGGVTGNLDLNGGGAGAEAAAEKGIFMRILEGVGSALKLVSSTLVQIGGAIISAVVAMIRFVSSSLASGAASVFGAIFGANRGGQVPRMRHFAQGGASGQVFGQTGVDKVFAALSAGEFVIRRPAVQRFGTRFLEAINQGRIPEGFGAAPSVVIEAPIQISATDARSFEQRLAEHRRQISAMVQTAIESSPSFQNMLRSVGRRGFS